MRSDREARKRETGGKSGRASWLNSEVWNCSRSSLEIFDNSDASSMLFNFFFSPDYVLLRHNFATAMPVSAVRRFKSFNTTFISKPASLLLICTYLQSHTTFNIF